MSTGNVAILLRANTMQIKARLGSMSITDDSQVQTSRAEFKQLLSIEGDNFADLDYQTFDPVDKENYKGVRSAVHLTAASLKLHYLEQPLHGIYLFLLKLAELKGLYDAATVAAVQRASEIERMQFNVSIKSPIVILPSDPQHSADALTVRLGELTARNAYEGAVNKTTASLRGIQLASRTKAGDDVSTLKIIQDIDIDAHVMQTNFIDRSMNFEQPDTQVSVPVALRPHAYKALYRSPSRSRTSLHTLPKLNIVSSSNSPSPSLVFSLPMAMVCLLNQLVMFWWTPAFPLL